MARREKARVVFRDRRLTSSDSSVCRVSLFMLVYDREKTHSSLPARIRPCIAFQSPKQMFRKTSSLFDFGPKNHLK